LDKDFGKGDDWVLGFRKIAFQNRNSVKSSYDEQPSESVTIDEDSPEIFVDEAEVSISELVDDIL